MNDRDSTVVGPCRKANILDSKADTTLLLPTIHFGTHLSAKLNFVSGSVPPKCNFARTCITKWNLVPRKEMNKESFTTLRSDMESMVWDYLESLRQQRAVDRFDHERTRDFYRPPYTETCTGQVWTIRHTYHGARTLIEGVDIDPDRTIEIKIAACAEWNPIVTLMSSLRDCRPISIEGGREAELMDAIRLLHDEIFRDWPLSEYAFQQLARRRFPNSGL